MNLFRNGKDKITHFLKQGLTPHDLALTMAFGVTIGVFPVLGLTSILCTVAAFALGLNMIAIQSVNWAMSPVQLLLIIPFTQLGGWLFGKPGITLNMNELKSSLETDFTRSMLAFMTYLLNGVAFWGIIALPLGVLVYWISFRIFSRVGLAYAEHMSAEHNTGKPTQVQ
jgi:uncharacterized protein (DUF2062 family)